MRLPLLRIPRPAHLLPQRRRRLPRCGLALFHHCLLRARFVRALHHTSTWRLPRGRPPQTCPCRPRPCTHSVDRVLAAVVDDLERTPALLRTELTLHRAHPERTPTLLRTELTLLPRTAALPSRPPGQLHICALCTAARPSQLHALCTAARPSRTPDPSPSSNFGLDALDRDDPLRDGRNRDDPLRDALAPVPCLPLAWNPLRCFVTALPPNSLRCLQESNQG